VRFGATETACRSCEQIYPAVDLDRYLWCPGCRRAVHKRGRVWGWGVGAAAALAVTLYIVLVVGPSRGLVLWALPPLMTYVLTSRIAVAVVQGYYRARGSIAGVTTSEGQNT
jgi:hypothetical protein